MVVDERCPPTGIESHRRQPAIEVIGIGVVFASQPLDGGEDLGVKVFSKKRVALPILLRPAYETPEIKKALHRDPAKERIVDRDALVLQLRKAMIEEGVHEPL